MSLLTKNPHVLTHKNADKLSEELDTEEKNLRPNDSEEKDAGKETDWKKRYSDLKSYLSKKENDFNAQLKSIQDQLNEAKAEKERSLPATEEELAAWIKQYPDAARIVESIAIKNAEVANKNLHEELELLKQDKARQAKNESMRELLSIHPDALEIGESDEFIEWLEAEDNEDFKDTVNNSSNPRKIARVITVYKKEHNISDKAAKEYKKKASEAIPAGGVTKPVTSQGKMWLESEIVKMSTSQYAKYSSEIDDARREGRIMYDLSQRK